eukprot:TRINITY_DN19262_c0_g1_i1.p1 TRINITY_DN19262_c0_g1~~TRINITY_DN19262_c0_g1_i1.p1  ORF type:complete len:521 (+),score=105.18 TRINITY_DN19262_c0_g1_i1:187-1749(+)
MERRLAKVSLANGVQLNGSPFVVKTFQLLCDPANANCCHWTSNGESFVVSDIQLFSACLPKYFKHGNFSSFVRQLNTYGFRKFGGSEWEFRNPLFLRDAPHLISDIQQRRRAKRGRDDEGNAPPSTAPQHPRTGLVDAPPLSAHIPPLSSTLTPGEDTAAATFGPAPLPTPGGPAPLMFAPAPAAALPVSLPPALSSLPPPKSESAAKCVGACVGEHVGACAGASSATSVGDAPAFQRVAVAALASATPSAGPAAPSSAAASSSSSAAPSASSSAPSGGQPASGPDSKGMVSFRPLHNSLADIRHQAADPAFASRFVSEATRVRDTEIARLSELNTKLLQDKHRLEQLCEAKSHINRLLISQLSSCTSKADHKAVLHELVAPLGLTPEDVLERDQGSDSLRRLTSELNALNAAAASIAGLHAARQSAVQKRRCRDPPSALGSSVGATDEFNVRLERQMHADEGMSPCRLQLTASSEGAPWPVSPGDQPLVPWSPPVARFEDDDSRDLLDRFGSIYHIPMI